MQRFAISSLVVLALACAGQAELHLQWTHSLPPRKPAWNSTQRMPMDRSHVPVVAGDLILVGCDANGALYALDANSGEERWRFYTNGPIRQAPVFDGTRIFLGSDDGHLYCLDTRGTLLWKFHGHSPSQTSPRTTRKVIGHERLMSAWPISARPVLAKGKVFFVAGYWPVDGIYVHALDAVNGKVVWTNTTSQFRPYGQMRVRDQILFINGHHGKGAFKVDTGSALSMKNPKFPRPPQPSAPGVKGTVTGRFQVGKRVVVCTDDGQLHCFGPSAVRARNHTRSVKEITSTNQAKKILAATDTRQGYCLVAGLTDGSLVAELLRSSKLRVIAVDSDAKRVAQIRRRLDDAGLFDEHRLQVLEGDPAKSGLPPYCASLIVSGRAQAIPESLGECLRPHGGVMVVKTGKKLELRRREGALPGSADWTHEFCNPSNTLASGDKRVKAPLGVLWYGGEAADARFYFDGHVDHQSGHGLNPQPVPAEIVEGRMILQGPGLLAAVDIYTGRVLWESPLPRMYTFGGPKGGLGKHSKKHPEPWRYPPALKYEVPPTHRCRASGFNFVSLPEGIYVAAAKNLLRFDPTTGKRLSSWPVPLEEKDLCWGGIRISDDVLVATAFRPKDLADAQAGHDGNGGDWAGDRMPMAYLFALDRKTGKLLWSRQAEWGFINRSGVAAGKENVYCVDLLTPRVLGKFREAGRKLSNTPPTLYCLDLHTGKQRWRFPLDVYVRNIVYSVKRDLLVVPCRNRMEWQAGGWKDLSIDIRRGKRSKTAPGKMYALRGQDGKKVWTVAEAPYHTPHILLGDLLVDRWGYTYDLTTGKRNQRISPLTGKPETWSFRKSGCNHLIACPNLVTWRTAFYDLTSHSGVMRLVGMDAGCSPTLLPAGGILNIPNFGTHHKRNRMTAMALVHRPNNPLWTLYASSKEKRSPDDANPLRRAGFNFGALGDRRDGNGTLWLHVTPRHRAGVNLQPKKPEWFQVAVPSPSALVTGCGVIGVEALQIPMTSALDQKKKPRGGVAEKYTVRLYFLEPQDLRAGERVFDLGLEGNTVLKDFDIAKQAGNSRMTVIRTFKGVEVMGTLDITLKATAGKSLLCGVEVIRE